MTKPAGKSAGKEGDGRRRKSIGNHYNRALEIEKEEEDADRNGL